MLKCWAQFWSKFQTLKNQFEQRSGRSVVPEPALKMGHRNQAKKTRNTKKMSPTQKPNASFCRKKRFWKERKVKNEIFDGLGLLAFLWPKICNDNSENTIKQGVLLCFCCVFGHCCPNNKNKTMNQQTTTIKTRASNHNKTTILGPQIQMNKEQTHTQKTTTTPNPTRKNTIEQLVLLFLGGCSFFGCCFADNKTKQQNNKQTTKTTTKTKSSNNNKTTTMGPQIQANKQQQRQQQQHQTQTTTETKTNNNNKMSHMIYRHIDGFTS